MILTFILYEKERRKKDGGNELILRVYIYINGGTDLHGETTDA